VPYLIYVVLGNMGFSTMSALTATPCPAVLTVFTRLRKHRIDALG